MVTNYPELYKFLSDLSEEEKLDAANKLVEDWNSDLSNSRALRLKAPLRYDVEPVNRHYRSNFRGFCNCGHSSLRHWYINGNFKDCKSCDCEGFYC